MYSGKYKYTDYNIIKSVLKEILSPNDYKLLIEESSLHYNQIHIDAMDQAYVIYEKYMSGNYAKGSLRYVSVRK